MPLGHQGPLAADEPSSGTLERVPTVAALRAGGPPVLEYGETISVALPEKYDEAFRYSEQGPT